MTTDEKIDRINTRLDELFTALLGDKTFGSLGYRQRIEKNETKLRKHEEHMKRIDERFTKIYQRVIGITIGITIAASVIGWFIQLMI